MENPWPFWASAFPTTPLSHPSRTSLHSAARATISTAAVSFLRNDIEVVGIKHGYSSLATYDPATRQLFIEGKYTDNPEVLAPGSFSAAFGQTY